MNWVATWPDFTALFAFCDLHASRWRRRRSTPWMVGELIGMPMYYDRQGFPIPSDSDDLVNACLVWARMMEADPLLRHVAQTDFPDSSLLSTVWLGIDHGFGGRPLFFETMYFSGEVETHVLPSFEREFTSHPTLEYPDPETGEMTDQLRYGSEEEALAAHHGIERRLRKRWEV